MIIGRSKLSRVDIDRKYLQKSIKLYLETGAGEQDLIEQLDIIARKVYWAHFRDSGLDLELMIADSVTKMWSKLPNIKDLASSFNYLYSVALNEMRFQIKSVKHNRQLKSNYAKFLKVEEVLDAE